MLKKQTMINQNKPKQTWLKLLEFDNCLMLKECDGKEITEIILTKNDIKKMADAINNQEVI